MALYIFGKSRQNVTFPLRLAVAVLGDLACGPNLVGMAILKM
jgi:hypothetical protein